MQVFFVLQAADSNPPQLFYFAGGTVLSSPPEPVAVEFVEETEDKPMTTTSPRVEVEVFMEIVREVFVPMAISWGDIPM